MKTNLKKGNIILIKKYEEKLTMTFVKPEEKEVWSFRAIKNPKAICAVSGCSIVKTKMKAWNENRQLTPIYTPEITKEMMSKKTIEKNEVLEQMIEKIILKEGIVEVKKWAYKHREEYEETEQFKELVRVVKEIDEEKDYSHFSYEDIRYLLRPFPNVSFHLKRQFNFSTLDYYTVYLASRYLETIDDHVNLVLSCPKCEKNMEKYFYNPVPLTERTRTFFPFLRTLYVYNHSNILFENDPNIIAREKHYSIAPKYVKRLEKVIDMKISNYLFDSNGDNWKISIYN